MLSVIVFGDSVSYGTGDKNLGWQNSLRIYLEKQCKSKPCDYLLYNQGIPGENTNLLIKRFDAECNIRAEAKNNTIIIFGIGLNDSLFDNSKNQIAVSEKAYESNLIKLIKKAKNYSNTILFVGLTPCEDLKSVFWDNVVYNNKSIKRYNSILKKVCVKEKVQYIDVLLKFEKKSKSYLNDGLHPNSKGHKLIYEQIKPFFVKFLKKNSKNL
jgi:lysophospholipase L1-like esterase